MIYGDQCSVEVLKGKTLVDVVADDAQIMFRTDDGEMYRMYHAQDCCESVYIESIVGDLQDLVGSEILRAETSEDLFDILRNIGKEKDDDESHTWTFYKLATRKGYVDIRWYGTSNGYYSESVDFERMK